jgi:hypothetical protein
VRIKGGRPLFLCSQCSHPCELISTVVEPPKKKPVLQALHRTVKLRLTQLLGLSRSKE